MPIFSTYSKGRLLTTHPDIQRVLNEAIKFYDFMVTDGYRPVAVQQRLYAQGRTEPGQIVTNVDGVRVKGMHNYQPSRAVDVVPWPGKWDAPITEFHFMAGVILSTAERLGVALKWGGHWKKFKDYPHFELDAAAPLGRTA